MSDVDWMAKLEQAIASGLLIPPHKPQPEITDSLAELRRMRDEIAALPEPIAYIVLDHACAAGSHEECRDARGRRYVRASPSFLDGATHVKSFGVNLIGHDIAPPGVFGIPLYRLEDVPSEWGVGR